MLFLTEENDFAGSDQAITSKLQAPPASSVRPQAATTWRASCTAGPQYAVRRSTVAAASAAT